MAYTVYHDWSTGLWIVRNGYLYRTLDEASWAYIHDSMALLESLGIKSLEGRRAVMECL